MEQHKRGRYNGSVLAGTPNPIQSRQLTTIDLMGLRDAVWNTVYRAIASAPGYGLAYSVDGRTDFDKEIDVMQHLLAARKCCKLMKHAVSRHTKVTSALVNPSLDEILGQIEKLYSDFDHVDVGKKTFIPSDLDGVLADELLLLARAATPARTRSYSPDMTLNEEDEENIPLGKFFFSRTGEMVLRKGHSIDELVVGLIRLVLEKEDLGTLDKRWLVSCFNGASTPEDLYFLRNKVVPRYLSPKDFDSLFADEEVALTDQEKACVKKLLDLRADNEISRIPTRCLIGVIERAFQITRKATGLLNMGKLAFSKGL